MFTLTKFLLGVCLVASIVSAAGFNFVYMSGGEIHFSKVPPSPPTKRAFFRRGKPNGRPSQKHTFPPPNIVPILLEHEAEVFCSSFLHISPFATTTTATITATLSTTATGTVTTTTSTTSTVDLGTTTIPTTVSQTTTTTTTDTLTDTVTDTATSTTTTSTTSTTYLHTAPNLGQGSRRRDLGDDIPPWLPFSPSQISSACSHFVTPKTKSATTTTTTTASLSATVTTTTTATTTTTTQATVTSTSTFSVTDTETDTETDTTTTTTSTTTTTTQFAVSTQCSQSIPVDGGGVGSSGTLTNPSASSPDQCCELCWSTSGCGLWFYFSGFGCFNAFDVVGPDTTAQCPTGLGAYIYIPGTAGDGNTGNFGPCAGSISTA